MRHYTKIEAWRLADDLTVVIHERTCAFPRDEQYGLTSRLRRAAHSFPANIVEGSSRESRRDDPHLLHIARGSLSETRHFLHLARRLGCFEEAGSRHLADRPRRVFACLHGPIGAVEKEAERPTKPAPASNLQ